MSTVDNVPTISITPVSRSHAHSSIVTMSRATGHQDNEETHNGSVRTADGCSHCYNILHEIMPIPIHTHYQARCVICCDPCQYPEYPRGHNIQSLQAAVKWRHCLHCQYLPIRHVTATGEDTPLELSTILREVSQRQAKAQGLLLLQMQAPFSTFTFTIY